MAKIINTLVQAEGVESRGPRIPFAHRSAVSCHSGQHSVGLQLPACRHHLASLGYPHAVESDNPAYRLLLRE